MEVSVFYISIDLLYSIDWTNIGGGQPRKGTVLRQLNDSETVGRVLHPKAESSDVVRERRRGVYQRGGCSDKIGEDWDCWLSKTT